LTSTIGEHGMVKVKVCGITSLQDAEKAIEFGADALGFNFYRPSPRCLTPEQARAMLEHLPVDRCKVAVFVNESRERVREILFCGRTADGHPLYTGVQFHGEEDASYCRGWGVKVIKTFRIKEKSSLQGLGGFPADFFLLDSWSPGYGGSGATFPWEWLEGVSREKLILSGGLNVDNVTDAIRLIQPYGVDVCSGVESRPGIKDHAKLKDFIAAAKNA
jgi:phosphoribosylanthranilate isomerase